MGRWTTFVRLALLASIFWLAVPGTTRALDADGNGIDDQTEIALAGRFCPVLSLHTSHEFAGPPVSLYPIPVEIMALGNVSPGEERLTSDRLFVLWRARPLNYPYGDHWVQASGWAPPLPESDPAHDFGALREDPPELRHLAPPAQPSGPYTLTFHWEYGNPDVNEPWEWYDVWRNGNAWTRPGSDFPPTAYAHLSRCETSGCATPPGSILIQYWFFFPFNDWVNNHEGDWEGMNVIVSSDDPSTAGLLDVEYFAHKVNLTRNPSTPLAEHCLVIESTHPVAFIGGHGHLTGCIGGSGEGEASNGFYPTPGRFEEVGEGDFFGCFDRADEELSFGAGPTVHWSDFHIEVLPNPETIDTAAEPERAWLVADLLWGTRRVPSVGGELWEDVGNWAPHGPAYNPEGRWGRVAAETLTRAYSRPEDPHPRPYRPAELAWVPFPYTIDTFTGMTANEPGNLSGWSLGTGSWTLAGGGLDGAGDGTPNRTNRAYFELQWPTQDGLPFLDWNDRAARFAVDVALAQPLSTNDVAGILVAGARGEGDTDQIRVVLRRTVSGGYAIEVRLRGHDTDSLVASASIANPGTGAHRLEALTLVPAQGGLFHDVWYDGALVLESIATPGQRDYTYGLLADGGARARFDRVSLSGLRLEPRFRHPPFAAFTTAPSAGAHIHPCPQLLEWTAVDEKTDAGIAEHELALTTDGGANWQLVAQLDGESQSWIWLPPEVTDLQAARLRLAITDIEGDRRTITGPSFWLSSDPVPVSILAPAGGEEWLRSNAHTIQWSGAGACLTNVDLSLSTDSGVTFPHTIATAEPNDGAFTWVIPDYLPAGRHCRVRVAGLSLLTANSPADFTILWDGQLAGGDFEHTEAWSLVIVAAQETGSASHGHGIGLPPLSPPLEGAASLFAVTRAGGAGRAGTPGAPSAALPSSADLTLIAESELVPVRPAETHALHFHIHVQAEVEEDIVSEATASARLRLDVTYRDTAGEKLLTEEIATLAVSRDAPGLAEEERDDIVQLSLPPEDARELLFKLWLVTSSEALGAGASAWAQAVADDLWFVIPIGAPNPDSVLGTVASAGAATIRVAPNPGRAGLPVRIAFQSPTAAPITLGLYDVHGRLVTRLPVTSAATSAWNEVRWNPTSSLSSGIYFWHLTSAGEPLGAYKWLISR